MTKKMTTAVRESTERALRFHESRGTVRTVSIDASRDERRPVRVSVDVYSDPFDMTWSEAYFFARGLALGIRG